MNKIKLLKTLDEMLKNLDAAIAEIQAELEVADHNNPWRAHALLLELKTMMETQLRWRRFKKLMEDDEC